MPKVLMIEPMPASLVQGVREGLPDEVTVEQVESMSEADLTRAAADAEVLVCFRRTVDANVLRLAPRVRFVQQFGTGYDNLDLAAIEAAGAQAANNPGWNSITVAEHTVLLMLALLRRFVPAVQSATDGHFATQQFLQQHQPHTAELYDARVGLVGFGSIGQAVAQRLGGFGARVAYTSRNRVHNDTESRLGAQYLSLAELLETSRIVSLHLPLTGDTHHMLGAAELARMPTGAVLINTSRGALVDETALRSALESGHLSGAALDVLESEDNDTNAFADLPQVIVTPHIAGASAASIPRAVHQGAANVLRFLQGEPIQHRLTRT